MTDWLLSPAARGDLDDIWDYSAATWGAAQAETYLRGLTDACAGLAGGTTVSHSAEHIRAGYRRAYVGRHVLFFRRAGGQMVIVRILHQRMDVQTQLP